MDKAIKACSKNQTRNFAQTSLPSQSFSATAAVHLAGAGGAMSLLLACYLAIVPSTVSTFYLLAKVLLMAAICGPFAGIVDDPARMKHSSPTKLACDCFGTRIRTTAMPL
jgi:hypothetical protein